MHTKDLDWYRTDVPAPEKSWPPSPCIDPLLISLHFREALFPYLLTDESILYLRKYGPVGARDFATLRMLEENGIPSYFSGCLSLTLNNPYTDKDREDIIYAVDIDEECVNYIRNHTSHKVVVLTHKRLVLPWLTELQKIRYVEKILGGITECCV